MEVEETKTTIADNESVLQRSKTSSVVEVPLPSKDDAENEDKDGHELEIQYASGSRLAIITLGVCLGLFVVALDTSIISTVIPTITTVFDSLGDVGWYGSAYLLVLASLQPSFGKIYTVFNLKAVYLISLIVFEVGSVVCAAATSSLMFIIGRAIAGLGASALLSGGMNILSQVASLSGQQRPTERSKANH
ncbi:major facilitator superfamily domain-containing protein [Lentinula raphanica]|nr:major facilitator superfamily domain-containing protein [Lentinula raphanica]